MLNLSHPLHLLHHEDQGRLEDPMSLLHLSHQLDQSDHPMVQ
jgi:hypothetical protein